MATSKSNRRPKNSTIISGLYVYPDIISSEQENELIELIDSNIWKENRTKSRKIQIFGPYHNQKWKIIPNKYTEHPEYSLKALNYIHDKFKNINNIKQTILTDEVLEKMKNGKRCELFVNEYLPGSGLRPHFDQRKTYDDVIIGMSLCSPTIITFVQGKNKVKVPVPSRSIYIMSGVSRYRYKHSISPEDITSRRISMTFRTIK